MSGSAAESESGARATGGGGASAASLLDAGRGLELAHVDRGGGGGGGKDDQGLGPQGRLGADGSALGAGEAGSVAVHPPLVYPHARDVQVEQPAGGVGEGGVQARASGGHEVGAGQAGLVLRDAQAHAPGGHQLFRHAQHRRREARRRHFHPHRSARPLLVALAPHRLQQQPAAPPPPAAHRHLPHPDHHHRRRDARPHGGGRRARVLAGVDPVGGVRIRLDNAVEVLADGSDVGVAGACDVLEPVACGSRGGCVHREHRRRLPVRVRVAHQGIALDQILDRALRR
eukprot:2360281-Rhodomonas_salina.1